uniref:Uncharacterized protein n=1 Tax=Rousettus aegyptiacus TaxID=9407 RepID=A0A7J8D6J1_ROUAE|nr:hypothetical protein HJG63_008770 [Rousettus aegyptiacus]
MLLVEEPSSHHVLVRDSGGLVALGPHTSISCRGGCDRSGQMPRRETCVQSESGYIPQVHQGWGELNSLLPRGRLVNSQVGPAFRSPIADSALNSGHCRTSPAPSPHPGLLSKGPGLPAGSLSRRLGSSFYPP